MCCNTWITLLWNDSWIFTVSMVNSWMMPVTVATDGWLVWVGGCWSKSKQRSSISEIVLTQVCCWVVINGWRFAYLCPLIQISTKIVLFYVQPLCWIQEVDSDKKTKECVTDLDTRAPLSLASSFFAQWQQNILIQVYWNKIQSPVGVSQSYFVSCASW